MELGDRGVSAVVGVALLVVIVVALAAGAAVTLISLSDESLVGPSSTVVVEVEESPSHTTIIAEAARERVDQLRIKVNGQTTKVWDDYSAGQTKNLFCLEEGDEVAVVGASTGPDGETESTQVLATHTMQGTTACQFNVNIGGENQTVTPVNWETDSTAAKQFYSFGYQDGTGHPHAHMPNRFTQPDTSYMFFYVYEDEVSLVVVHDQPDEHDGHCDIDAVDGCDYTQTDTGGGAVDMWFEGLPDEGEWVVKDDPNDFNNVDRCDYWSDAVNNDPKEVACFSWATQHTDGGVYSGGFSDTENLNITIHSKWNEDASRDPLNPGEIDSWQVVTRDEDGNIVTTELDMGSEIVITGANAEVLNESGSDDSSS